MRAAGKRRLTFVVSALAIAYTDRITTSYAAAQ